METYYEGARFDCPLVPRVQGLFRLVSMLESKLGVRSRSRTSPQMKGPPLEKKHTHARTKRPEAYFRMLRRPQGIRDSRAVRRRCRRSCNGVELLLRNRWNRFGGMHKFRQHHIEPVLNVCVCLGGSSLFRPGVPLSFITQPACGTLNLCAHTTPRVGSGDGSHLCCGIYSQFYVSLFHEILPRFPFCFNLLSTTEFDKPIGSPLVSPRSIEDC